jgi:hypothetical protein
MQILLLAVSPQQPDHSCRSNFSHGRVQVGWLNDSAVRGKIEEVNHSFLHCGNYARRVPLQKEDSQWKKS